LEARDNVPMGLEIKGNFGRGKTFKTEKPLLWGESKGTEAFTKRGKPERSPVVEVVGWSQGGGITHVDNGLVRGRSWETFFFFLKPIKGPRVPPEVGLMSKKANC